MTILGSSDTSDHSYIRVVVLDDAISATTRPDLINDSIDREIVVSAKCLYPVLGLICVFIALIIWGFAVGLRQLRHTHESDPDAMTALDQYQVVEATEYQPEESD